MNWPLWYPSLDRAWPTGDHERLLLAAVHVDPVVAERELRAWIGTHDLDDCTFSEQRLILATWNRLGPGLRDLPDAPRLAGLQRMLWTRTMLLMRECQPAFAALAEANVPMMLIKGAARAADPVGRGGRSFHDLDIVVPRNRLGDALQVFIELGWEPSSGSSAMRMLTLARWLRSVNLHKGRYGDIDLHGCIFRPGQGSLGDDDRVWERARSVEFNSVACGLPVREDLAVIAVANGGLDAHANSDWLVDLSRLIVEHGFDWRLFSDEVLARDIAVPALIALGWLKARAGYAVDLEAMRRFEAALPGPMTAWMAFVQARPRQSETPAGAALRWLAKTRRKSLELAGSEPRGEQKPGPRLKTKFSRGLPAGQGVLRADLPLPASDRAGILRLHIRLPASVKWRRLAFEINSDAGHIAAFHVRPKLPRAETALDVFCEIQLDTSPGATRVWLESRPLRSARMLTEENAARYAAPRFWLVSSEFGPGASPEALIDGISREDSPKWKR
ncbi:nucleotidyltransferase family protein [Mesorhizobium sp. WSM4976]|uniref:nucleotidyltransferase family protein n=1 Tax=Mesorhizobium sp. WSM4976 TaxID=3038549 RepID=UPI002417BC05|nr:nucleotidyltransferase family protein [Mesorhizobium sp. WSM4976]MDG4898284.1 nucleotidyltransferase family protein [Mesorhizobium sp. WSM4976]